MTPFDKDFPAKVETINSKISVPNNLNNVRTFITQLPVVSKEDYLKFMTSECYWKSIVIGSCGTNSDQDKFDKTMKLKILRQQILNNFGPKVEIQEFEPSTPNNQYIHILSARRKLDC